MDGLKYERTKNEALTLEEEDKLTLLYTLMENLNNEYKSSMESEYNIRRSSVLLGRTLMLMNDFDKTLKQIHYLSEALSAQDDLVSSNSSILR